QIDIGKARFGFCSQETCPSPPLRLHLTLLTGTCRINQSGGPGMKLLKTCALALFATGLVLPLANTNSVEGQAASEAQASMDLTTNVFVDQSPMYADRGEFEQVEGPADGIGPLFNNTSCAACHANPITGAESLVTELRAGHSDGHGNFVAATVTINDGA